jgi:hypothetical protein
MWSTTRYLVRFDPTPMAGPNSLKLRTDRNHRARFSLPIRNWIRHRIEELEPLE